MKFFLLFEGTRLIFPDLEAAKSHREREGLTKTEAVIIEAENAYRCENGLCERTQGEFSAMRSIETHGMVLCGKCCRELFPLPVDGDVIESPCI